MRCCTSLPAQEGRATGTNTISKPNPNSDFIPDPGIELITHSGSQLTPQPDIEFTPNSNTHFKPAAPSPGSDPVGISVPKPSGVWDFKPAGSLHKLSVPQ